LIDAAVGVLRNKNRELNHVCEEICRELNLRWVREHVGLDDGLALFSGDYPATLGLPFDPMLIVGRRAFDRRFSDILQTHSALSYRYRTMRQALPFAGDEHAALILTMRLPKATVIMYGLAEDRGDYFQVCGPSFAVTGPRPDHEDVRKLISAARGFWNGFAGKRADKVLGGRPEGSGKLASVSKAQMIRKFRRYRSNRDNEARGKFEKVTVEDFATHLGCTDDTFRNWMKTNNMTWDAFMRLT
jgi:hypothetical protein